MAGLGRTLLGFPADMGAAWVHGTEGNPVALLLQRRSIRTWCTAGDDSVLYDHDLERYCLFDVDGEAISHFVVKEAMEVFEGILDYAENLGKSLPEGEDLPFTKAIEMALQNVPDEFSQGQKHRVLSWFVARLEGWFCASMENISVRHFFGEFILGGGTISSRKDIRP